MTEDSEYNVLLQLIAAKCPLPRTENDDDNDGDYDDDVIQR